MPSFIVPSGELKIKLKYLRSKAIKKINICSAFCQSEVFESLFCGSYNILPEQRLLVRWRLDDLVSGVSDIDTYYKAKENGWDIYINFDLHAKCYVFDEISIIGSANMTNAGISDKPSSNIELCVLRENDIVFYRWLTQLFHDSIKLNDKLFSHIQKDFERVQSTKSFNVFRYSNKTLSSLYEEIEFFEIFTYDFPWSSHPEDLAVFSEDKDRVRSREHDFLLFTISRPVNMEQIRHNFLKSKCWKWLVKNVGEEKYFGELTNLLHNDLADDPIPFRKNVKSLLQNLLVWAVTLTPDFIVVDQPRHSKRVRLI